MKKSFSLLEIIVVIVIVSIISSVAFVKFFNSIEKSNITKIKSEVALINAALGKLYSSQILLGNSNFILKSLDEAQYDTKSENLFGGYNEFILLDYTFISTSSEEKKIASWIKISSTTYKIFLNKDKSVEFIFDKDNASFSCNKSDEVCKEFEL